MIVMMMHASKPIKKTTHFKKIFFIENNLFSSYVWVLKFLIYKELATGNWFNPFNLVCLYTGIKFNCKGPGKKFNCKGPGKKFNCKITILE
jgi:hypothetical protein